MVVVFEGDEGVPVEPAGFDSSQRSENRPGELTQPLAGDLAVAVQAKALGPRRIHHHHHRPTHHHHMNKTLLPPIALSFDD
jgi:hypothetical protein